VTCFQPLKGFRARSVNENGKRNVVFNRKAGYVDLPVTVPCGQCIGCRLERSRQWAIRCYHEASLYEDNSFVTLTYRDEDLPNKAELGQCAEGTLVLRDLQLFMKRLRKEFGAGIRYYACGEYGEKFGRPHYHLCLFNFDPPDKRIHKTRKEVVLYTSEILDRIWGLGFTLTGAVTFQSAAYVARYIMKKITGPEASNHYETLCPETGQVLTKVPEFTTMSRRPGIGKEWYEKFKTDVFDHDFVVLKGKKLRPPRYYDRQYEITNPSDYNRIKRERVNNAKLHTDDQSPARLKVRETVQNARLKRLPRNLD